MKTALSQDGCKMKIQHKTHKAAIDAYMEEMREVGKKHGVFVGSAQCNVNITDNHDDEVIYSIERLDAR